ncbi:MAG: PEP-CTERM sorting domain-containing protein [Candidatus Korobacteraceae bacterium]
MKKNVLGAFAVLFCALVFAARSQADAISFTYSGDGVAVSGTLFGGSNGNGTWTITGITGTYDGITIAGLVPLGADPSYIYNNLLYYPSDPLFVDNGGILFNVPGVGDVNFYYDPSSGYVNTTGSLDSGFVTTPVTVDFSAPTPEPATLALVGTGILGTLAVVRRRTSQLARSPHR